MPRRVLIAIPTMRVHNATNTQIFLAAVPAGACVFTALQAQAAVLTGANLQKRTDAILGLMVFSLIPDVTTGSLSIANTPTGNPDIAMSTLGGGFTVSRDFPLYLEGTAGYSRYDPSFLAAEGVDSVHETGYIVPSIRFHHVTWMMNQNGAGPP
ncbi:MAG TPA: hypothetical protein VMN77_02785 [Nitrospiria bacterium]|nr:hypothetical protein [Nitrospiria bacterium]